MSLVIIILRTLHRDPTLRLLESVRKIIYDVINGDLLVYKVVVPEGW